MQIPQRARELPTSTYDTLFQIIQIISRVENFIQRKFFEDHIIISQSTCFITQKILDSTQLFRNRAVSADCFRE